ncbi:MAG: hydrogenase expression/formation protein HypE [Clostridiales bacterium]|nr:hydrogenase expression/formation protein HypE [Clostridiales bacterium]
MDDRITLAHGAGGSQTSYLIDKVFKKNLSNPFFTADDASVLPRPEGKIAMSTDGFIVSPPFFNGGNIGKLSVCGTVNDLSCMGARPLYLTCSFIIEEGLEISLLEKAVESMAKTAEESGVVIVAGDTKVAGKGQVDKLFITTTGVGEVLPGVDLSGANAKTGDKIIVTGDIGRHGCCILLSRDDYGIDADVKSDCAPLWKSVERALNAVPDIHVIRDATRGGVGTVLYEIAAQSSVGIKLVSSAVPVSPEVRGVCGLLGLEPLYLACEGTLVMITPPDKADLLLETLHKQPYFENAQIIGEVISEDVGHVVTETEVGTETYLPKPGNELLPRIC